MESVKSKYITKELIENSILKAYFFLIVFLTSLIISRWLGPIGKGSYSIYMAGLQVLTIFFNFGISSSLIYFISAKKINLHKIKKYFICYFLFCSLVFAVLAFASIEFRFLSGFYPKSFHGTRLILLFWCTLWCEVMLAVVIAFFVTNSKFKIINIVQNTILSIKLIIVVLILENIIFKNDDLMFTMMFINFLFQAFVLLVLALKLFHQYQLGNLTFESNPKENLGIETYAKFAMMAFFSSIVHIAITQVDLWIIDKIISPSDLGFFAMAKSLNQITLIPVQMIIPVLLKYISSDELSHRQFLRIFRIKFYALIATGIFLMILPKHWFTAFCGLAFADSFDLFKILFFGFVFFSCKVIINLKLSLQGKIGICLFNDVVNLLFVFGLSFYLTSFYGVVGSAYAFTFANLFSLILIFFFKKDSLGKISDYFVFKSQDFSRGI